MRPTRMGWGCLAMAALTLLTAASTGNNLLYLLYSALTAGLIVAAIGGRLNLRGLRVAALPPDQVYRGSAFPLEVALVNDSAAAAFGVEIAWQGSSAILDRVQAGETGTAEVRGALPHRGINELTDLTIESSFPLGLFRQRKTASAAVLALPRPREAREAAEIKADARASGRPTPRKGAGDELYGIRDYAPGDDARAINWKLTARSGRPLVNEYCASHQDRITVSVRNAADEKDIEEAAAACRFHIQAGAQVRLESSEETVEYGRGLLQLDRLLKALARLGAGRSPRPSGLKPAFEGGVPRDSEALRRLTMLGATLTFAGMFLIDEVKPSLLAALSPVVALGWLVQIKRWKLLPQWGWNALSLATLAYVLLLDWRVSGVTVSNTHLLLYLLLNRMLNPFERRDLPQVFLILFLAFFLISGLTISLTYFAAFLAFVVLAAAWLTMASGLAWARRRAWGGGVAAALAAVALITCAFFTATPRVEGLRRINPFLAAGIDKLSVQESSVTGFTSDVSLGFYGRLKKSSARVMRVKPLGAAMSRDPGELRLRGAAFDRFDGNRWSKSPGGLRRWAKRRGADLLFPAAPPEVAQPVYDVTIYPMKLAALFTVGTPRVVQGVNEAAFFDHTDSVQFPSVYIGGVHYQVHPGADAGFSPPTPASRQPPPDPSGRLASLAREATAQAAGPMDKVRAVEAFLRRRYDYSDYSDGRDRTLEDFLFKTRRGNCEYFATAAVALLRLAGIPARLATGFVASDWNEYGRFYDVRQSEAHAWVEAYVDGRGWVVADPTPAQGSFAARAESFGRRVRHWFTSVQTEWYRRVIGYDQYAQRDTFHRLGGALSARTLRGMLRGASYAAGLAIIAAALCWGAWRARLWWTAPTPTPFALAQAALARAGFRRQSHWTPREFAAWVVGRRPELAAVAALAELHYLHAYNPAGLSPEQLSRAHGLLGDIRSRL